MRQSRRKAGRLAFEANILDGLADAIVLIDANKAVVDANEAARKLFGGAIINSNLDGSMLDSQISDAIDQVLKHERSWSGEFTTATPVQRTFEVSIWKLEPRARRKASWALLVLHDVTHTKRADKMRADFISNVSHELRSPLTSLVGFIETLQTSAKDDPDAQQRFLSIMEAETARMKHMIDHLLLLSKLEAVEHIQPEERVDLVKAIEQASTGLLMRAKKRNISINLVSPKQEILVAGDEIGLIQVFRNLLENAIVYGDTNSVITVSMATNDIANTADRIYVGVTNFGEPIAAEHLDRLTERFYRIDKGRSRAVGGTGLGLAIVKHVVNRHRGELSITSTADGKTTFTICLPRANSLS